MSEPEAAITATLPAMTETTDESGGQRRPTAEDIPAVIEAVSHGDSLRAACRKLGLHAPSTHTFIDSDRTLREQYGRAREQRAEHFQEEALTVTKAAALGEDVDGKKVDPAGVRVYLDAIKWATGRMAPKTAPVTRVAHSFESLTDEELDAEIEAIQRGEGDDDPDA